MTRALLKTASPAVLFERRLVDERRKVVLIRKFERGIELEEPAHRQLQRAPRVEAGCARVGMGGGFRLNGRVVLRGKLGLQEREITHGYSYSSLTAFVLVGAMVC